ncbi:hypothetical protein FSP39_020947 [Pinctada imbricata]|uniref:Uncharacterized protein n=1 Tax=Pinctada imbricata TaxID=66713 RepID=A0AA88YK30_PINIB|nr:hypothetical protein FSP39_020947 [Pinctada imbricata]
MSSSILKDYTDIKFNFIMLVIVNISRFKQRKYNVANGNGHPIGITDLGLRNISLTRRNIDSSSISANRSDSDSLRGIELYELNGSVPDTLCRDDSRLFNLFYERDDTPLSSLDKVGKTTGENMHLCACSESYLYEVQNDVDIENMGRGNRTCQMHRSNIDNNNDFAVSSFETRRNRSLYGRGNMTLSMDESLLINSYRKLSARYTNSCSPHLEMVKSESTNEICKVNIELKNEDVSSGGPILYVKESISTERLSRIYFHKRESSLFEEVMGELARRSVMMNMPGLAEANMTNCDIVHYSHQLVRDEAEHENNHKDT